MIEVYTPKTNYSEESIPELPQQQIENGTVQNFTEFQPLDTENVSEEAKLFWWFINASEIAPGASAIIGDNHIAFFAIHHIALCLITVSFGSSIIVISQIHSKWKNRKSKLDFPIRFPLYLAIADMLWGISHFTDHIYLVTFQTYPESYEVKLGLSINLWLFFGYQQLMHASIAVYTYLTVVHRKKLDLGKWEWKLHVLWISFLVVSTVFFQFLDAFGNSGYWMGHEATTLNGQLLGATAASTATFNAFSTTFSYRSIRKTVLNIKTKLKTNHYTANISRHQSKREKAAAKKESVASQCLTTYVYVASFLYCPLAFFLWSGILFGLFLNAVEPVSCLIVIIVANSSGWANAYGYFHNEKLKKKKNAKGTSSAIKSSSAVNSTTDKSFDSVSSSSDC